MADKSFWSDKKDKKWWGNFWYYYRFRILVALVFVFLAATGLKQCLVRVNPDCSITIAGAEGIRDTVTDKMETEFTKHISDVDGKDGAVVSIFKTVLSSGQTTGEYQMGSMQQLFLEMEAGESYLYIVDRDRCLTFADQGQFEDISSLTGDSEPTYYVNVSDNEFLNSLGFEPETDMYAAIRKIPSRRAEFPGEKEKQNNAYKILKEILK